MPDTTPADAGPGPARQHRRRVLTVILVTQLCLALVTGVAIVLAYRHFDSNIDALAPIPEEGRPEMPASGPQGPLNILVMGSDSRDGENDIDGQTGIGQRSDVTMLLHVSADREDAYGVSLPRDALVDRPDCVLEDGTVVPGEEEVMFNDAFAVGGPTCTWQQVEALTDIRIDHAVVVDFHGFVDMVDAVGGVEVCLPQEVADPEHDIYLDAGPQTLGGRDSLSYVRERTQLSVTGDIGRMKRQQAFVASMVNSVVSAGTLSRPDRVYAFLDAATDSLTLDAGLDSLGKLVDLALQLRETGLSDIEFVTVPFEEHGAYRLVWSDSAAGLWRRIRHDRPLGAEYDDDAISAGAPPTGTASPTGAPGGAGEDATGSDPDPERSADNLAFGLCT